MLNKAGIDAPPFVGYESARAGFWQRSIAPLRSLLSDPFTLQMVPLALLIGRAVVFRDLAPFGMALFVAVRLALPELSWPAALGLLLGAALRAPGAAVSLLGYMGIYCSLERFLFNRRWRRLLTALTMAGFTCLLVKVPIFMLQPPSLFDLACTALEAGLVMALAYVFLGGAKALTAAKDFRPGEEQVLAISVVLGSMLLGLEGWSLFGIALRDVAAYYFVMSMAFLGGPTWGTVGGIAVGVMQNLAHPALLGQAGLYAGAGLVAGLFKELGKLGVALGFTLSILLLTIYGALPGELWQLLYGAFAAFLLLLFSFKGWQRQGVLGNRLRVAEAKAPPEQRYTIERLKELEAVFNQLAETFAERSNDESFLVEKNFNALMDHVVTDVCEHCNRFNECWQQNFYKSYRVLLNMLALADAKGELDVKKIPEPLAKHCRQPKELLTCANYLVKVYKLNLYWQKRMQESRSLVANQLQGVSAIMHNLTREMHLEKEEQVEVAREIQEQLSSLKIPVEQVQVYWRRGRMDVVIHKDACVDDDLCKTQLIPLVSSVLGRQVRQVHPNCAKTNSKDQCILCLSTGQPLKIETGIAQACRTGAGVSGDTASVKLLPGGKLAVLLSDGMGNGPEASRESKATVAVLEQLLRSGFDKETAVQTINSVLMLRSSRETFATVDMTVIDLYSGVAELTKIGAAAAFLKREDKVECIKSTSLPAGILQKIDAETRHLKLRPGDILVMISDGLLDSQKEIADKEEWFTKVLERSRQQDPKQLVKYLLDRASMNTRNQLMDDMTVIAVRVTENMESISLVS